MANKTDKTKKEIKTVDATGRTLGRVASEAAALLIGKDQTSYQRNVYSGSPVKVVNASKLRITAKKLDEIFHTRYSGYPGGLRIMKGTEITEKRGMKELIKLSVHKMLPKNKLQKEMIKNLKVED
jgi:large subunit ribosomal protein L13